MQHLLSLPKKIEETTTVSESSEVVKTEYDDRFKSVVIVKNSSKGSFGSGFYIAPNLILTNFNGVIPNIEVIVSDGELSDSTSFNVTVNPVNDLSLIHI